MVQFLKTPFLRSPLLVLLLLTVVLSIGCAQKIAPDGGPRDSEPAEVIATNPATGQRNVTDRSIQIEFSDYVNQSIRSAISVQPAVRFSTNYFGNEIDVEFLEDLEPNTTYAVTLGTNWTDLAGNKPQNAMTMVFSTGPDIDSGTITGRVYASKLDKVYIVAYPRADTLTDDFSPAREFPPYSIPVGSSGEFAFRGLQDGLYRVLAVDDANGNGLLDASESYSMTPEDVLVADGTSQPQKMLLGKSLQQTRADSVALADTSKPGDSTSVLDMSSGVDSSATENVTKKKPPEPGAMEGTFTDSLGIGGPYLARFINDKGEVIAAIPVVPGSKWSIDSMPPGTYAVDIVIDNNGNGLYDHGRPSPYTFSERWFPLLTTVAVRQRWTTEGVTLALQ